MLVFVLLACRPTADVRPRPADPTATPPAPTTGPAPTTATPGGARVDDHVAIPFRTVGERPPAGVLGVRAGHEPAVVAVGTPTGPFEVDGDGLALEPDAEATIAVRYAGPVDEPTIATGTVSVTVADARVEVALAAVVGDPDLPGLAWSEDDRLGAHAIGAFPSAPFPDGSAPWTDASVAITVPPAFEDDGPVAVVTHLHGFGARLDHTLAYQHLEEQHADSGVDAIHVVPQGPVDASSGDFGRLEADGGHARLVRDVISALYRDGYVERPAIGAQVVTSHSGGYAATASLLDHGGLPIAGVFLYDSVYGYVSTFEEHAVAGGVLFSSYTATGGTDANNRALRDALEGRGVAVAHELGPADLAAAEIAIGFTEAAHPDVMTDDLAYRRWLAAGPLPRGPRAAPELLCVRSDGARATVTWRADRRARPGAVVVEGSDDGVAWAELGRGESGIAVDARAQIRLRGAAPDGVLGEPGDAYPASGDAWLVVDGFDRVFGGSWSRPTHPFAGALGAALGASGCSDEAVADGIVALGDFERVLWLLGDESTADRTFDDAAAGALLGYLDRGGRAIVSGAELGYATDDAVLDALGAWYVADDAGTTEAAGREFGVAYPEDYPDVLDGDEIVWRYATGGGAAVGRGDRRAVAVGFPLETLDPRVRDVAVAELAAWLR